MTLRSLSHTVSTAARRESSKALAWAAETLPICFTLREAVVFPILLAAFGVTLASAAECWQKVVEYLLFVRPSVSSAISPWADEWVMKWILPIGLPIVGACLVVMSVVVGALCARLHSVAETRLKAARAHAATAPAGEAAP